MKKLNVGLIGYGFMGRAHSNASRKVNNFFDLEYQPVLKAVCARDAAKVQGLRRQVGLRIGRDRLAQAHCAQGHRPDRHHLPEQHARGDRHRRGEGRQDDPVREAAGDERRRGLEDGGGRREGRRAEHGLVQLPPRARRHAGQATDRRRPARAHLPLPREVPAGLDDLKDLPQGGPGLWRLDVAAAGSGVTGDLLAHCIDTALWLNGGIDKVNAMTETFIKERKHNLTGKVEKVGIDDACAFLARFKNGSLATFESTRYARGHKALYTFEINGEHASIFWDLHDLHRLQYFDHRDEGRLRGWRSIHVTDGDHPYMGNWWVPGLQIGYEHSFVHQVADFLEGVAKGKPASPTFRDALETQYVCDAVLKSAKTSRWQAIAK